jgi:hypothetical protein
VVFTHALICFRKLNERASAKFVYFIDDTEFLYAPINVRPAGGEAGQGGGI